MLHIFFHGKMQDNFGMCFNRESLKTLFDLRDRKVAIPVEKREFTPFGVKIHLENIGWVWEKFTNYFSPFHM